MASLCASFMSVDYYSKLLTFIPCMPRPRTLKLKPKTLKTDTNYNLLYAKGKSKFITQVFPKNIAAVRTIAVKHTQS
jgi:hypothetical protein